MAQIKASNNDKVYTIKKWLGVNENADGDTNLRMGEASTMKNFKITDNGSLQKRPGTKTVASLLSAYTITAGADVVLDSELNASTKTYTVYPTTTVTSGGAIEPSGTSVTMDYATHADYADYIYKSPQGVVYKFVDCVFTASEGTTAVTGGYVTFGTETVCAAGAIFAGGPTTTFTGYSSISIVNGAIVLDGTTGELGASYPYASNGTIIYKWTRNVAAGPFMNEYDIPMYYITVYGQPVSVSSNDKYEWTFKPLTLTANSGDTNVRALWSGKVGTTEYIVASCNNHLWSLTETNGVWSKTDIGEVTSSGRVSMFGFGAKLYILNGTQYYSWDGTTLADVGGYVPVVAVAVPPTGGGTALQRVNMLNGKRRVRFSPTGSATVFQLPETSLSSIDYVKNLVTGTNYTLTTDYTVSTTNGTVTFGTAPASGTSTVEVAYTVSATLRSQVVAMTLSELFNGVNDNRVFLYGDGSNKTIYSDLDLDNNPTAEYFPDMNVARIGEANRPITGMVRHYDRLLAYKPDSTYSLRYDAITLTTGTVTAGFHIDTVNRSVGSTGYGQTVVVNNQPRTLDGRAIIEWTAVGANNEQRSAQVISQKVGTTLSEIDFTAAVSYYDKVNKEYYVVEDGVAIVQNIANENKPWYIYRDFPAICMIVYKDELYFGTENGTICHVSRTYMHDNGVAINCYWESGSMDFGTPFAKKCSDMVWVVLKPESDSSVNVTVQTDRQSDYDVKEVSTGFFDFTNLNFLHFTFNVNDKPQTQRRIIKIKNFVWYKLVFSTASSDTTVTVLNASVKMRQTGIVR